MAVVIIVDKTSPRCPECRLILPAHRTWDRPYAPRCSQAKDES